MEGFATPLSHSNEFQYWCSESAADQEFGALGSFFSYDLSGKNTFGFIQEDDPASAGAVITRTEKFIEASCSSRVLLLLPSTIHHKFITIAHLSGCPLFLNHQDVSNFSLVLAVNKESILTDPINWSLVAARLSEWSHHVRIPETTDARFRERRAPLHQARVSPLNSLSLL